MSLVPFRVFGASWLLDSSGYTTKHQRADGAGTAGQRHGAAQDRPRDVPGHWDPPQREKYERLFRFAAERELTIYWGSKRSSLRVPVRGGLVSILEGYPPGVAPGYLVPLGGLRRRVRGGEELAEWYRGELKVLGSFNATAKGCAAPSRGWTRWRRRRCTRSSGSS